MYQSTFLCIEIKFQMFFELCVGFSYKQQQMLGFQIKYLKLKYKNLKNKYLHYLKSQKKTIQNRTVCCDVSKMN